VQIDLAQVCGSGYLSKQGIVDLMNVSGCPSRWRCPR